MADSIFLLRDSGELVSMTEQGYVSEGQLQELLASHPQLLSGDQVDPEAPRRWLLVLREAGIPDSDDGGNRWSVDHLFLDQDGIPTLVEVKRSSDSRIRREVVGQMLDYAANALVYWPHNAIQLHFERSCDRRNLDPRIVLDQFLDGEQTVDAFWDKVKNNLQAQRVRLIFVADEIPPELQRIVEFLNGQMERAEVLALEVRQYAGEGHRTLVPRVLGHTADSQRAKTNSQTKIKWSEASLFEALSRRTTKEGVEAARRLLVWGHQHTSVWWGEGAKSGSFIPIAEHNGTRYQLFAVYTYGRVEVYFQHYANKPPFDQEEKRLEILERLNSIPNVDLPADSINRRPSFPVESLAPEDSLATFCATFEWFLKQVE